MAGFDRQMRSWGECQGNGFKATARSVPLWVRGRPFCDDCQGYYVYSFSVTIRGKIQDGTPVGIVHALLFGPDDPTYELLL